MATTTDNTKFHNLDTAAMADLLGALDTEAKALDTRMAEIKAELKARGVQEAAGERYTINRVDAVRWTLDTSKVKQEMGEAWATARSKMAAAPASALASIAPRLQPDTFRPG